MHGAFGCSCSFYREFIHWQICLCGLTDEFDAFVLHRVSGLVLRLFLKPMPKVTFLHAVVVLEAILSLFLKPMPKVTFLHAVVALDAILSILEAHVNSYLFACSCCLGWYTEPLLRPMPKVTFLHAAVAFDTTLILC